MKPDARTRRLLIAGLLFAVAANVLAIVVEIASGDPFAAPASTVGALVPAFVAWLIWRRKLGNFRR